MYGGYFAGGVSESVADVVLVVVASLLSLIRTSPAVCHFITDSQRFSSFLPALPPCFSVSRQPPAPSMKLTSLPLLIGLVTCGALVLLCVVPWLFSPWTPASWSSRLLSPSSFAAFASSDTKIGSLLHPLSSPNLHRLALLFDKLERGEEVSVGVVGGSNSAGWGMLNWRQNAYALLRDWLQRRWPPRSNASEHRLFIAARAATTSAFTSLCLDNLLPGIFSSSSSKSSASLGEIDLLLVEFAVNDHPRFAGQDLSVEGSEEQIAQQVRRHMERLVRQVLRRSPHCALLFVYFAHFDEHLYSNIQEQHEVIARHYAIPSVSFKDIITQLSTAANRWPELLLPVLTLPPMHERHATNKTLMKDSVHASDLGHYLVFELLRSRLSSLHEAYVHNERCSFSPPWLFAREPPRLCAHFGDNKEVRSEGPLPPALLVDSTLDVPLGCAVLSRSDAWQLNQTQAEVLLRVEQNRGWRYEHAPNRPDKYQMQCNDDCMLEEVKDEQHCCSLEIRLPPSAPASASAFPRLVMILFNRSWKNMSNCWAWLTCSTDPELYTQPVLLQGQWHSDGTQMSLETVWNPVQVPAVRPFSASRHLPPALRTGARLLLSSTAPPPCDLDTLHLLKKTPGVFQFIGYIWS